MRRHSFIAITIAVAALWSAAPAAAQTGAVISVNGIYQGGTEAVSNTVSFTANAEAATFTSNFPVKSGPGFDAGLRVGVRGAIGVAIGITRFTATGSADVTAKIPHPFFFNQPRSIAGTANLSREETTTRLAIVFSSAANKRLQVSAFVGPAFFSVKQTLVEAVSYTDSYPYDTATFGQATTKQVTKSKTGVTAGAEASYFFAKHIGIGLTAAVAKATIPITAVDGSAVSLSAGGTQIGAGLRFRF